MHDPRTHLLLHTLRGLVLESSDLINILSLERPCAPSLRDCVEGDQARAYLRRHTRWFEESERQLEESAALGIRWCHLAQADYPEAWRSLSSSPLLFSYRGEPVWLEADLLAVVGSRTPMVDTRLWMQRELVDFLKSRPAAVVSGGARGIDQLAHRLAVECGRPTINVQPTGLRSPYPPGCERLIDEILDGGGCVLSTFALDECLRKFAFPVRNRWIAGLARACFVVEANRRSGSALTARLADDEGRPVWTLPVFPFTEQARANLDLIADGGAELIRDAHDLRYHWDRLAPAAAQTVDCKEEKKTVH